jgi:predicted amidohydrolase
LHFQQLALKYCVDLVPGSWTVQEGAHLYNTVYYINRDGSVAGSYRKIHLWSTEAGVLTRGSAVSVFPTAHGLVGLTICWDIAFPEMFTEMTRLGAELVVSPTYWSFTLEAEQRKAVENDEILLIDSLCTTRAFESDILFAYCNAAGELKTEGTDAVLSGRSQITHPTDRVLCKARGNAEELLFVRAVHMKRARAEAQLP